MQKMNKLNSRKWLVSTSLYSFSANNEFKRLVDTETAEKVVKIKTDI